MADYLLVLGERKALAWVVSQRRMAFPVGRGRLVGRLRRGDRLLLYTTRSCFHSPKHDRGRVVGEATIASDVRGLETQMSVAGVLCGFECDLDLHGLAPFRMGAELAPLVPKLEAFPDPGSWSARLRTVLLPLTPGDAAKLRRAARALARDPADVEEGYVKGAVGPRERRGAVLARP